MHPLRVALRERRAHVLDQLSTAFAQDVLGLDELDRRVEAAHAADRIEDLDELVRDLVPDAAMVRVEPGAVLAPSVASAPPLRLRAVFGNLGRRGAWRVAAHMQVSAIFGNVELDLCEVDLPVGVTHVHARAVFGNIEIVVPAGVTVDCEGQGILGSFENQSGGPTSPPHVGVVVRVVGSAVFGNVEIRAAAAHTARALLPGAR